MTGQPPQSPDPNVGQPAYGAPDDRGSIPGPPDHGAPAGGEGNAVAIVALVLGIIGIVTALFTAGVLGILLGIVAIILGVLGRRKVRQGRSREHGGLALGGVITGVVSLVIGLALLIFTIYIVGSLFNNPEFQQQYQQQQELQEQLQGE